MLAGAIVAGSIGVIGVAPADGIIGAGHPRLQIDVVVNAGDGYPTGSLQVHRECSPAGNAASADSDPFTTSANDVLNGTTSFLSSGQSCVVSVVESGAMDVSFSCATTNAAVIACDSDRSVTWVKDDSAVDAPERTATVTVTFDVPPPPPPTPTTAPAVEVAPTFTG